MSSKTLLIFDLDGVLIDSKPNMEKSWKSVQTSLGITTDFNDYFSLIGRPFSDIMDTLGLNHIATDAEKIFRIVSMQNLDLVHWYYGVEEMLNMAQRQNLKLAVVTSKDQLRTSALLAMLPVEFAVVQTPSKVLRGKPAPDHLLMACALANTDPAEALYIGDMVFDYEAAQRAGIDYAHAAWGYGNIPASDCPVIQHVDEILPYLNTLRS